MSLFETKCYTVSQEALKENVGSVPNHKIIFSNEGHLERLVKNYEEYGPIVFDDEEVINSFLEAEKNSKNYLLFKNLRVLFTIKATPGNEESTPVPADKATKEDQVSDSEEVTQVKAEKPVESSTAPVAEVEVEKKQPELEAPAHKEEPKVVESSNNIEAQGEKKEELPEDLDLVKVEEEGNQADVEPVKAEVEA